MNCKGCMPYRIPPCIRDEYGNNSCRGQPMEKNHRCTRMCYGDQDIDFEKDHRFSMIYYISCNSSYVLNFIEPLL